MRLVQVGGCTKRHELHRAVGAGTLTVLCVAAVAVCVSGSGNGIRNSSYSFAQYDSEWTAYAADIANAVSSPSSAIVQGATFASKSVSHLTVAHHR